VLLHVNISVARLNWELLRFPLIPAHQTAGRAEQMQTDRGTALLWYLDLPDLLSPYTVLLLSLYLYVCLCERHSMGCLSLCPIPLFLGLNTVLIGIKQRHRCYTSTLQLLFHRPMPPMLVCWFFIGIDRSIKYL